MADEVKKTYKVKEGQTWGVNPELQAGDTVELTEKEAAGFLDKLEEVGASHTGSEPIGNPQGAAVPKKPPSTN